MHGRGESQLALLNFAVVGSQIRIALNPRLSHNRPTLPRLLTLCMPLAGVAWPVSADEMRDTCDEVDTTRSSSSGTRRRLTCSGGGGGDVLMVYPPLLPVSVCGGLRYET